MRTPAAALTRDAPDTYSWAWRDWFRSLVPEDAVWHRCCIGIPDEPERHLNVSWDGWRVQQVAGWYEITSGRTTIIIKEAEPLRHIVAVLRLLGALPMPQAGGRR